MLSCREITEIVTAYLEGRMSFLQRLSFQMHVGMCRHCRAYLRQMRATILALGHLPAEPMPDALRQELGVRLHAFRERQQANGGVGPGKVSDA